MKGKVRKQTKRSSNKRRASSRGSRKGVKKDLRREIRALTLKTIKERQLTLSQLSQLAQMILTQTSMDLQHALPRSRRNALGQVVGGLTDAWEIAAKAATSSLKSAKRSGLRLAQKDAAQLTRQLRALEKSFVGTLNKYSRRFGATMTHEMRVVKRRMKKTGKALRPVLTTTSSTMTGRAPEIFEELFGTGKKIATSALKNVLSNTSNILDGLERSLKPSSRRASRT